MVRRLYFVTALVGFLTVIGFMIGAGTPGEPRWWLSVLPFLIWAAVPFVVMVLSGRRFRGPSGKESAAGRLLLLLFAGVLLIVVASIVLLFRTFVLDLDAQGGLVFVALPIMQIAAFLPFLVVASLRRRRWSSPQ